MSSLLTYFERLYGRDSILISLVIISRERAFENCTGVDHVVALLDCNVSPVRNLDDACHVRHRQKWGIVLVVDHQFNLTKNSDMTCKCLGDALHQSMTHQMQSIAKTKAIIF